MAATLLDDAETRRLARLVRAGGPAATLARARLAEANMGLVVAWARMYCHRGLPLMDLIGYGSIGLVQAIDRFDPERGARFSTYASWWIKVNIRRGLDHVHFLMIPEWAQRAVREGRAETRQPCIGAARAALRLVCQTCDAVYPMAIWLADDRPDDRRTWEDAEDLEAALATLPCQAQAVLTLRYGLGGREPMTRIEIGQALDLSRHAVYRIEMTALASLRERIAHED